VRLAEALEQPSGARRIDARVELVERSAPEPYRALAVTVSTIRMKCRQRREARPRGFGGDCV